MERKGAGESERLGARFIVSGGLLAEAEGHLLSLLPAEGGGVWIGRLDGSDFRAEGFFPLANASEEQGRFEADPRDLVRAVAKASRRQLSIVATVHSHPNESVLPSLRDLQGAFGYRGVAHMIYAFPGRKPVFAVYLYSKCGSSFTYRALPVICPS